MIIGTGIDLVDSRRIEKLLKNHGDRFFEKYCTEQETIYIKSLPMESQALSLAKRFAAKEACAKAVGTGFRDGIVMRDMEVTNDSLGKPIMTLSNVTKTHLGTLMPANKIPHIHLSMTDEPPYAQAQIIIEAI